MECMKRLLSVRLQTVWPVAFLLAGTSWLLGPVLNTSVSARLTLVSQYEASGQPYAWLFRSADIVAALLLLFIAWRLRVRADVGKRWMVLGAVGIGMLIDPIAVSYCRPDIPSCIENPSLAFTIHAIETPVTALLILAASTFDAVRRRRWSSVGFVGFQVLYGVVLLTGIATAERFNTLPQLVYQSASIIWLAWYVRELWHGDTPPVGSSSRSGWVRRVVAAWIFGNGALAIIGSLTRLHDIARLRSLYFAGDTDWLAQHGIITGVVLLYVSRHLLRGERTARMLTLVVVGLMVLRYSAVTPGLPVLLYMATFAGLFVARDQFYRGRQSLDIRSRLREIRFLGLSLLAVCCIALLFFVFDRHRAETLAISLRHFIDFAMQGNMTVSHARLPAALLAHSLTALLLTSTVFVLWILFRPSAGGTGQEMSRRAILRLIERFGIVPDDYFAYWPDDKQYFTTSLPGFVAYKTVGRVHFALADPISPYRARLVEAFVEKSRSEGYICCFVPVRDTSKAWYTHAGLNVLQMGSSAEIPVDLFVSETMHDKWWRWRLNKAKKQGLQYRIAAPPHSSELLVECRRISDAWLQRDGRAERAFALGYFDIPYLENCVLHLCYDFSGKLIAFTNQLPTVGRGEMASVDMLRYDPHAEDAMPYLLAKTIESVHSARPEVAVFDLGFVPFARANNAVIRVARVVGGSRFSAHGLEQFKNKFDPQWRPIYIAYDGDLADLAAIAASLEKAMAPTKPTTAVGSP